jgi:hypothetical protein
MKKVIALAVLLASATGCTYVTSGQPGLTPTTGEAWYTKSTGIGMLVFSTGTYYCPKDSDKCAKAEMKAKE